MNIQVCRLWEGVIDIKCIICGRDDLFWHQSQRHTHGSPNDNDLVSFICSRCVSRLLDTPGDKIKAAYREALDKGEKVKASTLRDFFKT